MNPEDPPLHYGDVIREFIFLKKLLDHPDTETFVCQQDIADAQNRDLGLIR
jgi:hypothetical protein